MDPKLADLLNVEYRGFIKRFNPFLATFSIKLMVTHMVPGDSIVGILKAFQLNFNLWNGLDIPTGRYFQSLRDALRPLNDEHARRLGY